MKKSTLLNGLTILLFAVCPTVYLLLILLSQSMPAFPPLLPFIFFFAGIGVARLAVRQKNKEEGRDVNYQEPPNPTMLRLTNIIAVIVFGVVALFLILKTMIF